MPRHCICKENYYNIYWTIQYILIYETLWFGFVPPTSKKYKLYLINHCKSTTSTTPTTISANLWQPMPGRLCDPFSSSTPLAPPSSTEWWNGPPSQTEWKNRENQHLQAERGHKPWMSIKKARDVVGYNVKNNFVNIYIYIWYIYIPGTPNAQNFSIVRPCCFFLVVTGYGPKKEIKVARLRAMWNVERTHARWAAFWDPYKKNPNTAC